MLAYKYFEIEENPKGRNDTHIKFSLSFNKDAYHWATSSQKEKGYQLTITPVERGDKFESFTAFKGFYTIILPVQRQSKKRLNTAVDLMTENQDKYLKYFEDRGYKIKKDKD